MAVVNVRKNWSGKTSERTERTRRYSEVYTVLLASPSDDQALALTAPGIPVVGFSGYPTDTLALCRSVQPRALSPTLYEVTATYEVTAGTFSGSPLDDPPDIEWTGVSHTEDVDNDFNGLPLVNTALSPYKPQPQEIIDPVLIVERNILSINPNTIVAYRGATNSDFFYSQPGQARLNVYNARIVYDGSLTYWRVRFEVQFRRGVDVQPDGSGGPGKAWYRRLLNAGFDELYQQDAETQQPIWKPIIGANGQRVSEPVPLNENGSVLAANENYVFNEFQQYQSLPFAPLGIL